MDEFTKWWMLQSKMPYRSPEEIARMAWCAASASAAKACANQVVRFAEAMNGKAAYGALECERAILASSNVELTGCASRSPG